MRLSEVICSTLGIMTLEEADQFVTEMANFLADVTDLPANIVLWTKTQPEALPHDKYRVKVFKDRIHVATYSISSSPKSVWTVNRKKLTLDAYEQNEVINVIQSFYPILIQYVDGKLNGDEVKYEIKKIKGGNDATT